MRVLVVGLLEHDSGKTTVAEAIVKELKRRGIDVGVSKPIAGHNAWYQFYTIEESKKLGLLVGEDALRLYRVAQPGDPLELVSPVDVIVAPLDPEYFEWRIREYQDAISDLSNMAVLARASRIYDSSLVTMHMIVPDTLNKLPPSIADEIRSLAESLKPEPVAISKSDLELFLSFEAPSIADEAVEALSRKHEVVVVESYNDCASPCREALKANAVVAVAPGRVAVYEGSRYAKAFDVASSLRRTARTREVLPLLRPVASLPMPVKSKFEESDTVERLVDTILSLS